MSTAKLSPTGRWVIPKRFRKALHHKPGDKVTFAVSADFAFQLTPEEADNLRCQSGTSSSGYGGRRYRPYAFTEQAILLIRGQRVMLDRDLAALYGVETKNLNKAVQRNPDRFPADFMFQLTADEAHCLRFQFGTLKRGQHFAPKPYRVKRT